MVRLFTPALIALFGGVALPALAQSAGPTPAAPAARAEAILGQMTQDEKLTVVHGRMPLFIHDRPADVVLSAGIVPGVPRLGVPDLRESDASLGVANAGR